MRRRIIDRAELSAPGKPLQAERWAGVVDTVGSHTLANACAQARWYGAVAACGLAQGFDLPATVMPFILRGVTLYGINSIQNPNEERREAWALIARHVDAKKLEAMTGEIGLSEVIAFCPVRARGQGARAHGRGREPLSAGCMYPSRIVCLTEEPTEVLYALGEEARIVGISGFTVRPARARKEKPKVSAFTSAKVDEITRLAPDLVIGFSDIQADIAQALVKRGVEVWIANHRSVDGIVSLRAAAGRDGGGGRQGRGVRGPARGARGGGARGGPGAAAAPAGLFRGVGRALHQRHRLGERADRDRGRARTSSRRRPPARWGATASWPIPSEVVRRAPDIIIGSWCGKKFRPERVAARPGWDAIPAVRDGELHEVKSPLILQPGPAALTDGLDALHAIIARWAGARRRRAWWRHEPAAAIASPCMKVCTLDAVGADLPGVPAHRRRDRRLGGIQRARRAQVIARFRSGIGCSRRSRRRSRAEAVLALRDRPSAAARTAGRTTAGARVTRR